MRSLPRTPRRLRGQTLTETLMAAALTALTLAGSLAVFLFGSTTWARGEGRLRAEMSSQEAVRVVGEILREAMAVTVDADGRGLTYRLPQRDEAGAFRMPIVWDNVTRRMEVRNGELQVVESGNRRTLVRDIILTDPVRNNVGYMPFTAGQGTITRSLTVMFVTQTNGSKAERIASRSRETIYLRNIPELSR